MPSNSMDDSQHEQAGYRERIMNAIIDLHILGKYHGAGRNVDVDIAYQNAIGKLYGHMRDNNPHAAFLCTRAW